MDGPKVVVPFFGGDKFNCPFCGAFSKMHWTRLVSAFRAVQEYVGWSGAKGDCCGQLSVWRELRPEGQTDRSPVTAGVMVYPRVLGLPMPHPELPEDVIADYMEAREIASASPRAAAALLRLCIEKLCAHLGGEGKSINHAIGDLVQKGLPVQVKQALDVVRVVGNNAVHAGQLSSDDVAAVSTSLFGLINLIVENQIAQPKAMQALYDALPQPAKDGVARRDAAQS